MSTSNGPQKIKPKKIWAGKLMPAILRGSKEHNRKLLEEKARVDRQVLTAPKATIPAVTAPLKASAQIRNISPEIEQLFERAKAIIAELPTEPQEPVSPKSAENTKQSIFYCDEVWKSPPSSPEKKKPLSSVQVVSPFSEAKIKARRVGLSLSDQCRGVYTEDELNTRIKDFAALKPW